MTDLSKRPEIVAFHFLQALLEYFCRGSRILVGVVRLARRQFNPIRVTGLFEPASSQGLAWRPEALAGIQPGDECCSFNRFEVNRREPCLADGKTSTKGNQTKRYPVVSVESATRLRIAKQHGQLTWHRPR